MSNELAIAGVTYTLQYYLMNLYSAASFPFANPAVTCYAPDQVQNNLGGLSAAENQVNLFLHQVTYNSAWRNVGLPTLDADGMTRLTSPPLALDLHYLLTVYGSEYWQAETLLGYALMMLHEGAVLVRDDITTALNGLTSPPWPTSPLVGVLGGCGLADQIEILKITPETLGREEMAWLWTALKADYRPTFPFQVTVVLMEPQQQTSLALPVISRSVVVQPQQNAAILQVQPPNNQVAAASTDTVIVTGEFLSGVSRVVLTNSRFGTNYSVPVTGATSTSFSFVPNAAATNPPGAYTLTAQFLDSTGKIVLQSTAPIAFAIAPTLLTATATPNVDGSLVDITFSPNVFEGQDVALVLTAMMPPPPNTPLFSCSVPAPSYTGNVTALSFQFPTLPSGPLLGRLIVDGVPSQVQVNPSPPPPFTPTLTI